MYVKWIACQIVLIGHCQNTNVRLCVLLFVQWICLGLALLCFQAAWHAAHVWVHVRCVYELFIENKLQFKLISISFTDRTYLGIQMNERTHAHTNLQTHDSRENEKKESKPKKMSNGKKDEKKKKLLKNWFNFILVWAKRGIN